MTCIVGLVKDGVIYMGGDSAGVAGLDVEVREDEKVFLLKDRFVIGFTTSFRMGNLLQFSLNPPEQPEGQGDYAYMCTGFIEAVRKCFADNGFVGTSAEGHNRDEGGQFLVGYHAKLYVVHNDFQVGKARTNYNSVGCGRPYAQGALFATEGSGMSPQNRIILALQAAVKFSGGVRPYALGASSGRTSGFTEAGRIKEAKMAKRRPKNVPPGSSDKNNARCGPDNSATEEKRVPILIHWCRPVTSKTVSELMDQVLGAYAASQGAPVRLMLTSPGGELTAGMHFLQTMRHLGIELQTVATYRVDSAGVLVFLAGKERYALPHARFLFHQPRTCGMIDAEPDDLHRITDDLEESRKILISVTAEILGQKAEVIDKLCVKGRPITAEKALEIGLIQEILK